MKRIPVTKLWEKYSYPLHDYGTIIRGPRVLSETGFRNALKALRRSEKEK